MTASPVKIVAYKDPALPSPIEIPEGPEWIAVLTVFDKITAETLLAATRTLYPHDSLPERIYRRVIVIFDHLAVGSTEMKGVMVWFSSLLNRDFPLPFCERSESYRVTALKAIEATPEFRLIQRLTVRYLYDDVELWAAFGYEGASHHLGGYVARGFDDLDWLPPIPADG